MPPTKKLKYFYCPKCDKTETQEFAVYSITHNHGGKLIICEQVSGPEEKTNKTNGKGVGEKKPTRGNRSKYVDGITGKEIGGVDV